MKRVTLADVANVAGVSVKTVSHVLSGNPTVRLPEATRERVRQAADQVGYRANRFAQAIQSGRTDLISVWLPLERQLMVYQDFLYEITEHAKITDHGILVTGVESHLAYAGTGPVPKVWPVDGMIVIDAGKSIQSFRDDPRNRHIPISVLGFETFANSDSVGWDVSVATYQITKDLLQSGCKEIVHLTLDWVLKNFPREQRRTGYCEAMKEVGKTCQFVSSEGATAEYARIAMEKYLLHSSVPDAIVCFNDRLAIGAIQALEQSGVHVPSDCKVWGFGDMPEGKDWSTPISTIKIPTKEIVQQSWVWLLERVKDPTIEPRLTSLPMQIICRKSA